MLNKSEIFLQNKLCLKNVSLLEVDGEAGIQGPWQKGLPPPGSWYHHPKLWGLGILPWGTTLSGSVGELAVGQGDHKSQGV